MRSPDQIGITWEENQLLMLIEIRDTLLEYRRQHNIFEAGDDVVVLTNALGNKYTWIVKSIGGIMVEISQLGQPNEWVHYSEIAHTTPEEIKAGKRLEVNQ